jgi:hypothetical protein
VLQLVVTVNTVPSSLILVILMTEGIRSSETLSLTRATWRNIPEDGILHSHCHYNLRPYKNQLSNSVWFIQTEPQWSEEMSPLSAQISPIEHGHTLNITSFL